MIDLAAKVCGLLSHGARTLRCCPLMGRVWPKAEHSFPGDRSVA